MAAKNCCAEHEYLIHHSIVASPLRGDEHEFAVRHSSARPKPLPPEGGRKDTILTSLL